MINNFKKSINEHIEFFNNYIAKDLLDYFHSKEFQNSINLIENKYKCKYLKQHFLKSYNLLIAILILVQGNPSKILIDEGKIIFRSLFENISNFIYIFCFDDIEYQNKLIEQFYDYAEISLNQYSKKFLSYTKNKKTFSKEEELILSKLIEANVENKINSITKTFNEKYKPQNNNTWSGISTNKMLHEINKRKPSLGFIFYKKYYDEANPYVHCNILEYFDNEGFIIENESEIDKLELIHKSIFLFFTYTDIFFNIIKNDFKNMFSYVYEEYENIDNNYHNTQRELEPLQI